MSPSCRGWLDGWRRNGIADDSEDLAHANRGERLDQRFRDIIGHPSLTSSCSASDVNVSSGNSDRLKQAGSHKSKILSANIWLTDMRGFGQMNEAWEAWIPKGNTPARATVEAKHLRGMRAFAEEELKAGNIDRATRLLGNAMQGTQRLGNAKATQALAGLLDQVKKTQTLGTKAAKTTLLNAQAVVRKTQMLDPEALKEFGKEE